MVNSRKLVSFFRLIFASTIIMNPASFADAKLIIQMLGAMIADPCLPTAACITALISQLKGSLHQLSGQTVAAKLRGDINIVDDQQRLERAGVKTTIKNRKADQLLVQLSHKQSP